MAHDAQRSELALVQRGADVAHTPMLSDVCAAPGAPPRRGNALVVRLAGCFILGAGTIGAAWGASAAMHTSEAAGCIVGGDLNDHVSPLVPGPGRCVSARTTADPRVFGPTVWKALHLMAQNFPTSPNNATQHACSSFLSGLPYMLPCNHCGFHLQQYLGHHGAGGACDSQLGLVALLVGAHNAVSRVTHPCRAPFTVEDAARLYSTQDVCFHDIVWAEEALVRE